MTQHPITEGELEVARLYLEGRLPPYPSIRAGS